MYTKHAKTKYWLWWICVKKSALNCTGGLTINGVQVLYSRDHNHAGDTEECATSSRDRPTQIFTESVPKMCPTVRPHLPTEQSCKRTIRNQRASLP